MTTRLDRWFERGRLPDWLARARVRRLLRARLRHEGAHDPAASAERLRAWLQRADGPPDASAIAADGLDARHHEALAVLFAHVLGPHRKFSACLWPPGVATLADAEAAMLALACARAGIRDGMRVLDLGCGNAPLGLWIGRHYPSCRVVTVCGTAQQQHDVGARAAAAGLAGIETVCGDAITPGFVAPGAFDRIVAAEVIERARDWRSLLARFARWLEPGGELFVQALTHASVPHELAGGTDALAWRVFPRAQVPADAQLLHFQDDFVVQAHWRLAGTHHAKTVGAWLANLDRARPLLAARFRDVYGEQAEPMLCSWRLFLLACEETWGFAGGREWLVSHYRLRRREC